MARFGLAAMLATAVLLAAPAVSMAGRIEGVDGPNAQANRANEKALQDCLAKIRTTGQTVTPVGDVISGLEGSQNDNNVTITFSNQNLGENAVSDNKGDESNGKGTGSTVTWNPHDKSPIPGDPGVNLDPCATLLHELTHSWDNATGKLNRGEYGNSKIQTCEVIATTVENDFRAANGLPQRTKYGDDPLPNNQSGATGASGAGGGGGGPSRITPPGTGNTGTGNTGGGTTGGGNTGGGTTGGGTTGGGTTGGGNTGGGTTGGGTTGGGNTGGGNTGGGNTGSGNTGSGNTGGGNTGNTGGGSTGGGTTGGGNTGAGNTGGGSTGGGTSGGGP